MITGHIVHLFVSLFVISNPLGNLPIFIGLTEGYDKARRRHAVWIVFIASAIIMLVTEWAGKWILHFFGITINAFTLGGGFVIFMIGYSMLMSKTSPIQHTPEEHQIAKEKESSIAVVPMSIPLLAGPGTMSTIIMITAHDPTVTAQLWDSLVIVVLMVVILVLLLFSNLISRGLGPAGVKIVTRIMGLVLLAIAVGMMAHAAIALFPGLR
ncbi:MAG: amino acid transporter [Coxiella sp. (in: Bacteria)]|nr:MAG: amino acid transporter [Coxiella sp. (in: g-proteobacteria)]